MGCSRRWCATRSPSWRSISGWGARDIPLTKKPGRTSQRPSSSRSGPGRPRDPEADESILRAAIEVFRENGAEGTSLKEIAARAGVATTTLYRRWSSKEDLLVDALGTVRRAEERTIVPYDEFSLESFMEMMAETALPSLGRGDLGKLVARLIGSVRSHPALMETYWKMHLQPRRESFTRSLERMKEAGALPPETDPEILQDMLAGTLLYRFLITPGKHTAEERQAYLRRLLRQLGFRDG